jgi:hypothetical protein
MIPLGGVLYVMGMMRGRKIRVFRSGILSLLSKNLLKAKEERTNLSTEQPASHFFVPNKEMGERKSA